MVSAAPDSRSAVGIRRAENEGAAVYSHVYICI